MKNRKMLYVLVFVFIILFFSKVDAITPTQPTVTTPSTEVTTPISQIWGNVSYLVQILAIGCVVFAGVRYMFAAPDKRADLKKGLIYLAIGSILVFGAVEIIQLVASIDI